jgi:hypothetical protein
VEKTTVKKNRGYIVASWTDFSDEELKSKNKKPFEGVEGFFKPDARSRALLAAIEPAIGTRALSRRAGRNHAQA